MGAAAGWRGPRLYGDVILTILIAGLFGHRQAPESPAMQTWHAVVTWTTGHWTVLAVVIPVAGAIVAGIMNHYLAVSRENRARRLTRVDVRGRVSRELAARLLVHCRDLGGVIGDPTPDLRSCRAAVEALHSRVEMSDVVEALGGKYIEFVAALDEERRAIGALERTEPPRDSRERFRWSVDVAETAYRAIGTYLPFVHDFGEGRQARKLQREAGAALKSRKKLRHA